MHIPRTFIRRASALFATALGALAIAAIHVAPAHSQSAPSTASPQGQTPTPTPAANPADVASVDAIVAALYDVISGPAGHKRDWDRLRSLFMPGGKMIPVLPRQQGGFAPRIISPDEYIQRSGELLEKYGFTESEIARRVERYGNIAHVFSTYEGRFQAPDAPVPPPRGINSIQLVNDFSRWWVMNIMWEAERPDNKLPEKYLKSATSP